MEKKYVVLKPVTHKLLLQLKLDLSMPSLSKTIRFLIESYMQQQENQTQEQGGGD